MFMSVFIFNKASELGWPSFYYHEHVILTKHINEVVLCSTEHEIYLAHKCKNANNCWHVNIY